MTRLEMKRSKHHPLRRVEDLCLDPGPTVHAILAVDARLTTEEERLVTLSCKRIFDLFYHTQQGVYPMLHALFPLFLLLRETKESEPFFSSSEKERIRDRCVRDKASIPHVHASTFQSTAFP